jgi:phospholipid/cholesterol/gamma-HCH transport system permease protein
MKIIRFPKSKERMVHSLFYHIGRYVSMLRLMISKPEKWSMYWKETMRQMNDIGIGSLIIVCLIALFIGAVAAVQFAYQLSDAPVPMYYTGYIVRDMTIIELAPTITCLVLAGKVGSNIAAEVVGMRQKEQIDALEIMGVNTASYLILPKIIAALIVIPMLVAIAAFVSIVGGYLAAVPSGMVTDSEYILGLRTFFVPYNVFMMFVKAIAFAFILTSVSAYQGFYVKGGSIELGKASTNAVVFSDIIILLADYVITLSLT